MKRKPGKPSGSRARKKCGRRMVPHGGRSALDLPVGPGEIRKVAIILDAIAPEASRGLDYGTRAVLASGKLAEVSERMRRCSPGAVDEAIERMGRWLIANAARHPRMVSAADREWLSWTWAMCAPLDALQIVAASCPRSLATAGGDGDVQETTR